MDRIREKELFDLETRELTRLDWLLRPVPTKILIVTDGGGSFDSVASFGLGRAITAMRTDPWWWVRFDITTAHRTSGARFEDAAVPHHDNFHFDSPPVALSSFDQIWLFGVTGAFDALPLGELAALRAFMDGGGGVLAMGDHADLGAGLCSELPRVKEMRRWKSGGPAGAPPPQSGVNRHDTCREGPSAGFQFNDQSDEVPQKIVPRLYHVWSPFVFIDRRRPHPVLCGRTGVIDILPDHMHEGEIVAPASVAGNADWPGGQGPEVIAWADVIPHTNTDGFGPVNGKRFGVLGAYEGHAQGVGRIVVDATWHHWFNINLLGFPAGATVDRIHNYYWNVGLWLSRSATISAMAYRAAHGLIFTPPFRELTADAPILVLGGAAVDALGRRASQCTVSQFVHGFYDRALQEAVRLPIPQPDPPPFRGPYLHEQFALGGVMKVLLEKFSPLQRPARAPEEKELQRLVQEGVRQGWKEMAAFEKGSSELMEKVFKAASGELK
ncbi:MAG: hypothetical protein QM767_28470 [Anaeromyxobacter sp.]